MAEIRDTIETQLVSSGQYAQIVQTLQTSLANAGWTDQFQSLARDTMQEAKDSELNLNLMMQKLQGKGKEMVPDAVKIETLNLIKKFLDDVVQK